MEFGLTNDLDTYYGRRGEVMYKKINIIYLILLRHIDNFHQGNYRTCIILKKFVKMSYAQDGIIVGQESLVDVYIVQDAEWTRLPERTVSSPWLRRRV